MSRTRSARLVLAWLCLSPVPEALCQGEMFIVHGESQGDFFGASVRGIGDINGDGVPELLAGAPCNSLNASYSGSARVLSGSNGAVLHTYWGDVVDERLGWSVSGAGDLNQDGIPDFLIGAPGDTDNGVSSGSVRAFSGFDGSLLYLIPGASPHWHLGRSVAGAGDANQDGFADFAAGAPNAGAQWQGTLRVYSGFDGSVLHEFVGDGQKEYLGRSLAEAGDVNSDGFDDLIAGAPGSGSSSLGGYARVYSGLDGTVLHTLATGTDGYFAGSVHAAGDPDGDGYDDVIVGAPDADAVNAHSGVAMVYSGLDGSVLHRLFGQNRFGHFGESVSSLGDFDLDGHDDLLVGEPQGQEGSFDTGAIHLFSGLTGASLHSIQAGPRNRFLGYSVDDPGDHNLDGVPDFLAGSPGSQFNGPLSGTVTIYSGVCGDVTSYGTGCPGSRPLLGGPGIVPTLDISGCSTPGGRIELNVRDGLGGATALLLIGNTEVSVALGAGCTLLVHPLLGIFPVQLDGLLPGEGTYDKDKRFPIPTATATMKMQVAVFDPGGAKGYSLTNAVSLEVK